MARRPKPWWRKQCNAWFVTIDGIQHRLAEDKEEAYRKFHELKAKPRKQTIRSDSVLAIFDVWLEYVKVNRAERTYLWYLDFAQSFTDSIPKTLAVADLKVHHVQRWADSKPTWSSSTKHGAITTVKRAMQWALTQGYIETNPIAFVEQPPITNREVVMRYEHYCHIVDNTPDREFRDIVTLAWETGARPQELFAVTANHVDFEHQRWVFYTEESKGKRIRRVIYLADNSFAITTRLAAEWPDGVILRNTKGTPWNKNNTSTRFRKFTEPLGQKYCLYHIRHTWITNKLLAGVNQHVVSRLAGHSDSRMIDRVYSHVADDIAFMAKQAKITLSNDEADPQ